MFDWKNFIVLLCFVYVHSASAQQFNWAKQIGGSGGDNVFKMAHDHSGHTYLTGSFTDTMDADPGSGVQLLVSKGLVDLFVTKLDAQGNHVFSFAIGNADHNQAYSIIVDSDNNFIICGLLRDTLDFDPGVGVFTLDAPFDSKGFVAKYDSNGHFLWAKELGGNGLCYTALADVDDQNNIYLGGNFTKTLDADPGPSTFNLQAHPNVVQNIFLIKLSTAGDFVWAKQGYSSQTSLTGVVRVHGPSVFLAGEFSDSCVLEPGPNAITLQGQNKTSFLAKWDTSGSFQMVKVAEGFGYWRISDIAFDEDKNIYLAGLFSGSVDLDLGQAASLATSFQGSDDAYFSKSDSAGNMIWVRTLQGDFDQECSEIEVDKTNQVYVAGNFEFHIDFDPGPDSLIYTGTGPGGDMFIAQYNEVGNLNWAYEMGSNQTEVVKDLFVDRDHGDIYLCGDYNNIMDFDVTSSNTILQPKGGMDVFVLKMASTFPLENLNTMNESSQIIVYPNPTRSALYCSGLKAHANNAYNIYTLQGQRVRHDVYNASEGIDVSDLPKGHYMLRFEESKQYQANSMFTVD